MSQPSAPIPEPIRHALAAEDPFEAFDHGMGMYAVREPFSRFERQRRRGALLETDLADTYPPYIPRGEDTRGWLVLSYRLATRVARDAASFSSAQYAATADAVMGKNLLSMDPPQHTRYRNLVNQTFAPSAIATWERELVRPIIRDTLAGFAQRGRADLTREYSFHFPVRIIAALFGMPDACLPDFHRLSVELQCVLFDYERGLGAARKVTEMFREVIEEHRREPRPDLLTALLEVELEGERLSEEEILGFMRLLLPAGLETTYRGAGNVLFSLLSHPEQLDAVRANRRLLDQAVEEALRWQPILTGSLRFTTRDTELEGKTLRAGDKVYVCWAAANRDPERWDDPARFDIFRDYKPHLTFGFGPHKCLGVHLAKMEMRVALDEVIEGLPDVRLDPEADDIHISGDGFRAPVSLPVVWTPRD